MSKRLFIPFVLAFAFVCLLLPGQAFSEPTPVGPSFTITKTDNGPFTVGTNGTYTITVKNVGTGPTTTTITVTDTLPAGLTFIVGTGIGWTCSASGQTVTCTNAGPIAAAASSTITLTVSVGVAAVPSVSNTASVSGGGAIGTVTSFPADMTTVNKTVKSGPAVYISTGDTQQILVVDGAVGTTVMIHTVPNSGLTAGTFVPEDIVVGPDKRIYMCDPSNNKIYRVRQDNTQFETIYDQNSNSSLPAFPEGPSFNGNDLYFNTATEVSGTGVWKIAGIATVAVGGPFPAPSHVFTTSSFGEGTAFDSSGNLLIVEHSPTAAVLSCNPSSCSIPTTLISSACVTDDSETPCLDGPIGIAVNSQGHIFVANRGTLKNINEFSSLGTFLKTYASFSGAPPTFAPPAFLEFDALDRLYAVTLSGAGTHGAVWRIDPPGGETNLVFLVALSNAIPGVVSEAALGVGVAPTAAITQHYAVSGTPLKKQFAFSTGDEVDITFPAILTAFDLTVFREEVPQVLLGLQLATNFANIPCAEYNSDRGTCVVYEEGVGSKLDPLPPADFSGTVDYQLFYTPSGSTGVPVLAHALDNNLQTPVDQYDENELTGFTLATKVGDPTGMDGGSGGLSRHVALNTPLVQTGTTFCGFQSPVPGQTFSQPQAVPVRFKIAASGGNCQMGPYVTNAVSQLWLFNTTTGKFVTPTSKSNTGNFFFANSTSGQNNYNIDTKNLAPGTYIFTMTSNSVSAAFSLFVFQ
jgi:uncharacterized repeat protein (TIGR01451 family)